MRQIFVFTNLKKDTQFHVTSELIDFLGKMQCQVVLDQSCVAYAENLPSYVRLGSIDHLSTDISLVIAVGGDGSLIKAAASAALHQIPVVGINMGRVGFLTELEPGEIPMLSKFFHKDYHLRKHMMLSCRILHEGTEVYCSAPTLNDIVLSKGPTDKLANIDLQYNGQFIHSYHADGVIIATPTGSTAYSMSAGGPIIEPSAECFCITPVCEQSMCTKPIIVRSDASIDLVNRSSRNPFLYLSCDGNDNAKVLCGDTVQIKKSDASAIFLQLKPHNFSENLRLKMQN